MEKPYERDIDEALVDIDGNCLPWEKPHARAYPAMASALGRAAGLPYEQMVREMRQVYTRHGTIEYAALVQEMDSFQIPPKLPSGKKRDKLLRRQQELIDLVRKARKKAMAGVNDGPYKNVKKLLKVLRANHLDITALSDAPKNLAFLRLKTSRLLDKFDRVIGTRSPSDELFDPRFHMEDKPFPIPVLESDLPKPYSNLEKLRHVTAEEVSRNFIMIGNSMYSDDGLARRNGMLFYHSLWEDGTAEDRAILAEFAPEALPAAAEQTVKKEPLITHPGYEMVDVEDPLLIIEDLHRRQLITLTPEP